MAGLFQFLWQNVLNFYLLPLMRIMIMMSCICMYVSVGEWWTTTACYEAGCWRWVKTASVLNIITTIIDRHQHLLFQRPLSQWTSVSESPSALFVCLFLPSNRHHQSYADCLEVRREDCQNCSVLCCVWQLCTMICTHVWTVLKFACSFRCRFCFCALV